MSPFFVAWLFAAPALAFLFIGAHARGQTAGWEQRHPVTSRVLLAVAAWCAAAGVVMLAVAALFAWVELRRSPAAGWRWVIGPAALFGVVFAAERFAMRAAVRRGLPAPRLGRARAAIFCSWPIVVAVVSGPAVAAVAVVVELTVVAAVLAARAGSGPAPRPPGA